MPRIENMGENVSEFCEASGDGSSTFDLCACCAEVLEDDPHAYDAELEPYNGDPYGDDGYGGDCEHPDYDEEDYVCEICGDQLTALDN